MTDIHLPAAQDDTFGAGVSTTVAVPVERLFEAFVDASVQKHWLPSAKLRMRTSLHGRSARFDWEDETTRVIVGFSATGAGRSRVALRHERLADARAVERAKAFWRRRLGQLKGELEGAAAA